VTLQGHRAKLNKTNKKDRSADSQ